MNLPHTEVTSARPKICTYEDYRSLPEGAPYHLIGKLILHQEAGAAGAVSSRLLSGLTVTLFSIFV